MKTKKCEICQDLIYIGSNAQKYCKSCAKVMKKLQDSLWWKLHYEKKHEKLQKLGTTAFSDKMCSNFGVEAIMVKKELKKLGFRRQFS